MAGSDNNKNEQMSAEEPKIEPTVSLPIVAAHSEAGKVTLGRARSYRSLSHANLEASNHVQRPNKRSSLGEEINFDQGNAKRAKSSRKRIEYYPRVKDRLESKPAVENLCLLRQLKYIENVMLEGRNVYSLREQEDADLPSTIDVEMVLLDLL